MTFHLPVCNQAKVSNFGILLINDLTIGAAKGPRVFHVP